MYWVYESIADQLHARHPFNNQEDAIAWADKMQREWAKWGADRHYQVFYHSYRLYEN